MYVVPLEFVELICYQLQYVQFLPTSHLLPAALSSFSSRFNKIGLNH